MNKGKAAVKRDGLHNLVVLDCLVQIGSDLFAVAGEDRGGSFFGRKIALTSKTIVELGCIWPQETEDEKGKGKLTSKEIRKRTRKRREDEEEEA
jgi:hypothetical protein